MPRKALTAVTLGRLGFAKLALAVMCLALAACGNYPTFDELGADFDALRVPAGWRLADTLTNGPGGDIECVPQLSTPGCPKVIRYYVAQGSPLEVYEQAAEMVVAAGFAIDAAPNRPCDRWPGTSLCSAHAIANDRRLWVQVWSPDSQFTNVEIEDRSGPIVSVSVWREGRGS
jgi:hypothetical protein